VTPAEQRFIAGLKSANLKEGWDRKIIYVHAYHETGRFKRVVGLNNYWGLKPPKNWTGKVVEVITTEFVKGNTIPPEFKNKVLSYEQAGKYLKLKIRDYFIDFDNAKDSIEYYENFIQRVYPQAFAVRNDYKAYYNALVSGKLKYATDPKYPEKLIRLYETLKGDF